MTKFIGVMVRPQTITAIEAPDLDAARRICDIGTDQCGVDFGTLIHWSQREDRIGLAIVVYEFGLLKEDPDTRRPVAAQHYFGLWRQLTAGNAVLFAYNEAGDTVDVSDDHIADVKRDLIWLPNKEEVEKAIASDLIVRPETSINGVVISRWPNLSM